MQALPQTKQQYVYAVLRREILAGVLRPGERLTLAELAERFGVSHIPIREALRQLEREDLVALTPHATATVTGITKEEALWVAELRLLLEPVAARQATGRLPPRDLEKLEALLAEMDEVVEDNDFERYLGLNFAFHQTIYAHCPNQRLQRTLTELWETAHRYALLHRRPGHLEAGRSDHDAILAALKAGDAEAVERLTFRHRERLMQELAEQLGPRSQRDA